MKDFDAIWANDTEEQRTFKVLDEVFILREAVRPEAMAEKLIALDQVREQENSSIADVMVAVDDFIVAMIEPRDDAEARYRALREREQSGLSAARIMAIQAWILDKQTSLVEEQTGRPPTSPPASSRGSRRGRTTSTDDSSSPALSAV